MSKGSIINNGSYILNKITPLGYWPQEGSKDPQICTRVPSPEKGYCVKPIISHLLETGKWSYRKSK